MAENTRNRGRAASLSGAGAAPTLPAPAPLHPARLDPEGPAAPPPSPLSPTDTEAILKRIDSLESKITVSFADMDAKNVTVSRNYSDDLAKLTRAIELSHEMHLADRRELLVVKQELVVVKEHNKRMETQLNAIVNKLNICNLRLDGMKEDNGENLKKYVIDMAHAMGVANMALPDIISAYRIGKINQANARTRPRTVLLTFVNERARNAFFFARSSLKGNNYYRGVYVNDDVSPTTRKQRDDYRAVAALARQDGVDVRVHSDGLILAGKKYLLSEPQTLPERYTINKAKSYEHGGEIYFASEASFLSNFSPSPIVEDDITYLTAEHMYQAYKCRQAAAHDKVSQILIAPSPLEAKRIADSVGETPEWRQARDAVMEKVILEKFRQNPKLAQQLLDTGNLPLNEATHNDHFGIGVTLLAREIKDKAYRGANKLGQILVARRAIIRAAQNS